jgi:hypothetical protein
LLLCKNRLLGARLKLISHDRRSKVVLHLVFRWSSSALFLLNN